MNRKQPSYADRDARNAALGLAGEELVVGRRTLACAVLRNDARALGTMFVVLRCPLDRQEPALAPLHPDLGFRFQFEGRLIQTSEPNLDERVTGTDWIKQSRPTERAEATSTIA
jgi:hypothetical protein